MVTQQELDELATQITDATTNIQDEISGLEKQISEGTAANDLDLTGLKSAAGALTAIETPTSQAVQSSQSIEGVAPTNPDGTATEHTEDPDVAAARTNLIKVEEEAKKKEAEDAARQIV